MDSRSSLKIAYLLMLLILPRAVYGQLSFTTNSGTITITGYTGNLTALTIPSATNGYEVTSIGNNAFLSRSSLTSLTILSNVTTIGTFAFYGCTSLTNVTIPSSLSNIGADAFMKCSKLRSLVIPDNVSSVGNNAFEYCTNLTTLIIGSGIGAVSGYYEFGYCSHLTQVYFTGNANPNLGFYPFVSDTNATVYYLPGTTGWGATYSSLPTVLWNPQAQINDGKFGVNSNQFGFNITGPSNIELVVEACTNISNPLWFPLQTVILTNGSIYFGDPQWTNSTERFYGFSFP